MSKDNKIAFSIAASLILTTLLLGYLSETKDYDYNIGTLLSNGKCKGILKEYNEKLGNDTIEVRNAVCGDVWMSHIHDYAKYWQEVK
jgi:hypothetical protein